jgi:hypothetical protein
MECAKGLSVLARREPIRSRLIRGHVRHVAPTAVPSIGFVTLGEGMMPGITA